MDSSAPCSLWLFYSLCCVIECEMYFVIKLKIQMWSLTNKTEFLHLYSRSYFLMGEDVKTTVFMDVTPCSLLEG
jgi:hypothetical protein